MADEQVFGHYRLLALLGRGGMGEVWHAHDTRKGRDVALKILGSWLGADPGYARRFRREAALAAGLNAPNIIPIHDYGDIDGKLFMEMPLIVGTDLDDLIAREGPLDPARAVDVIEQIAAALDTAHHAGLVHRDVKPSNALITAHRGRDFVYLIDFGIAHSADGTRLTTTGRELGTLTYMAPERFQGAADDQRGDVYALACVLFQSLTGQAPFVPPHQAHALAFYVNAHLHLPPPRPSVSNPTLPETWDEVIARGMAKNPDQRYPSAGELAAAAHTALTRPRDQGSGLGTAAADTPPPAITDVGLVTPSPTDTGRTPSARRAAATTASAPAAVSPWTPATDNSRPLPIKIPSPPPPPLSMPSSGPLNSAQARRSPRRRRIALLALALAALGVATALVWTSWASAPIRPIGERQLTGHTGAVWAVATAQLNGHPVAVSGSNDDTVRVWDLTTGQPVGAPFTSHSDAVWTVATAQLNGRPVAVSGSGDKTVRVWDLATGQPIGAPFAGDAASEFHTGGVYAVAVVQLNGRPVVISGGEDDTVRLSDLTTGQPVGSPFTVNVPTDTYTHGVYAVAAAQLDDRPVAISGNWDGTVRAWDLTTGQPIGAPFTGHTGAVEAVTTTQLDGRTVVISGSQDKTLRAWDLATGQPIGAPFTGHNATVRSVAVAQLDGRTVVISGSDDQTVRVWDLATGKAIGSPFTGHTDSVTTVAAAQLDGRPVVISGSADKTVRVWDLSARASS